MKTLLTAAVLAATALTASAASATSAWIQHGVHLNARSGPGTYYDVLGTFDPCTRVHIVGYKNGWAKVSFNNSYYWVSSKYLRNSACGHSYKPKHKPRYNNY